MARKTGEVIQIRWYKDAAPPAHVVFGHVSYEEAVASLTGVLRVLPVQLDVREAWCRHRWARWVQAERILRNQGVERQLHLQDKGGRGLFPVTVLATSQAGAKWR